MSFDKKTLRTLEFDKICDRLVTLAATEGAKAKAAALLPDNDPDTIRRRLTRTTDAKRLVTLKGMPAFGGVKDVGAALERAEKGATLSPRELLDIAGVLRCARVLSDYSRGERNFTTVLDEIFDRLIPNRVLEERIFRSIPAEDMIADEASPALAEIRRTLMVGNPLAPGRKSRRLLQLFDGLQDLDKRILGQIFRQFPVVIDGLENEVINILLKCFV